ncbi:MAG: hypothetical protein RL736_247 [Pseudomonadota bacterium]|jgi:hypothetical protein
MENIKNIGEKIKFKDGTEYSRMPNGELRRMSPRAYQIRKYNKKK